MVLHIITEDGKWMNPRYTDPSELSFLRIAISCSGTIVLQVLRRLGFWIFLFLHLTVYICFCLGYLEDSTVANSPFWINWQELKLMGKITIFFEVFYAHQSFKRYLKLHKLVRAIFTSTHNLCLELRTLAASFDHTLVLSRYLVTSVLLFCQEMRQLESGLGISERFWNGLVDQGVLLPEERNALQGTPFEQRTSLLYVWSADVMRLGEEDSSDHGYIKRVTKKLQGIRDMQQQIVDFVNLPIPFQYFHLLNVMLCMNLAVWAYGMAVTESIFGPVVFIWCEIFCMGLMELSTELANPFGEDLVDFPLAQWQAQLVFKVTLVLDHDPPSRGEEKAYSEALEDASIEKQGLLRGLRALLASQDPASARETTRGSTQEREMSFVSELESDSDTE